MTRRVTGTILPLPVVIAMRCFSYMIRLGFDTYDIRLISTVGFAFVGTALFETVSMKNSTSNIQL